MRKLLRFADLVALGIVKNRATLKNWINHQGFPAGRLAGPNCRLWSEAEIDAWLASRPTAPKPAPKRGRKDERPEAEP